jgi:hypothetical protein
LPAEEVGVWAIEKHNYLKRYLDISRGARRKFWDQRKPEPALSTCFARRAALAFVKQVSGSMAAQ